MDNNNPIIFQKGAVAPSSQNPSIVRAKSFKVNSPSHNFAQYINAIKAYALAGMPFEHIANAGEYLGDKVERGEINAPLKEDVLGRVGETVEDESKILSWQNRGEVISVVPQLSSPNPITGQELVQTSQGLTINPNQEEKLNVLEGIAVYNQPNNSQLENNPYLQALPIIK